jgi:sugar phosphate isomerase/epimerase
MGSFAGKSLRVVSRRFGLRRYIPREFHGIDGTRYHAAVIGDGIFDYAGVLRRLADGGYDGHVSIEYEGSGDLESAYRRGLERVRSVTSAL